MTSGKETLAERQGLQGLVCAVFRNVDTWMTDDGRLFVKDILLKHNRRSCQ
jgi:hypothetical protein